MTRRIDHAQTRPPSRGARRAGTTERRSQRRGRHEHDARKVVSAKRPIGGREQHVRRTPDFGVAAREEKLEELEALTSTDGEMLLLIVAVLATLLYWGLTGGF